jgi:hypothetical protein
VRFRVLRHGRNPRRYVVIHGNETTAEEILREHLKTHGGIGYAATNSTRNVQIGGLKIDPNRMFSRSGAQRSVQSLNGGANPDSVAHSLRLLDRQRPALIRRLIPHHRSRLVALHNNRGYSVRDEIAASDRTSIKEPDLPGHFFLCTSPADFEILQTSPYNVVLQSKPEPDDGSLSRLSARLGFRYINLECVLGEGAAQVERLDWLERNLS